MSLWTRIVHTLRPARLTREIDEELRSHLAEAIEQGRDPGEARRALGRALHLRETSRDLRLLPWLDTLRADAVFGLRQLAKRKLASAAAILSLALAIGACTAAFRLIDALLFRPLPIAGADRLYSVSFQSPATGDFKIAYYDSCSYPMFERFRAALHDRADLVAVSLYNGATDLTYASDAEMEKAQIQGVSGSMFATFGLRPALGRLLTEADDAHPGASPYAVLSYDYWTRRFGRDPKVLGRTFQLGNDLYQIVGVAQAPFTGTETGWVTDIFVPITMHNPRTLASLNNFWLRSLILLKPGVASEPIRDQLRAIHRSIQEERVKGFPTQTKRDRDRMFAEKLFLEPASAGRSNLQRDYRQALAALGLLVVLVLLIACANVANLMTARAAARAREMALRVSIGAGRARLVQLVLVECGWLALFASALGAGFAWWSAPYIVARINSPIYAAHLVLPADWRVLAFGMALAGTVTFLFGLIPALRASSIQPVSALRGDDPHSRRRLMHALIAIQVAFCFVIHAAAGLFVGSFERLVNQPTGFSSERLLNLESVSRSPQSPVYWEQVEASLRTVPGVEEAATIGWPLMSGESAVGNISINGAPPSDVFSDFVLVSPGWAGVMRTPFLSGRDFRPDEAYPRVALVNQAFAKQYFEGRDPVGQSFERVDPNGPRARIEIVGWIRDARSRSNPRLPIRPTAYIPFRSVDAAGALRPSSRGTFVVRTAAANPLALAGALRRAVSNAHPGFRVSNIRTQTEINQIDTTRERLLAILASFFAAVALLLAGIGLYGVLDYAVVQRRRELGIRIAIGAQAGQIARTVTVEIFAMVLTGAVAGLALTLVSVRTVESLLFQVKATDLPMLALPSLAILAAATLAAIPAIVRALRIDPVSMLRAD